MQKKWSVVSGLIQQEHNRFTQSATFCLKLCSLKWLRPRCKRVRSHIPTGLWILYVELGWGRPIFSNEALNKENGVAPLILSSSIFHSFMTFGKNELLNASSHAPLARLRCEPVAERTAPWETPLRFATFESSTFVQKRT